MCDITFAYPLDPSEVIFTLWPICQPYISTCHAFALLRLRLCDYEMGQGQQVYKAWYLGSPIQWKCGSRAG